MPKGHPQHRPTTLLELSLGGRFSEPSLRPQLAQAVINDKRGPFAMQEGPRTGRRQATGRYSASASTL